MMSRNKAAASGCAVVVLATLFAGCAQTEPSRFYLLSSVPASEREAPLALAVAVGPVTLPAYLDRPQIVRRQSPYMLELAEFDRWGEPLDDLVPRVLAENLALRLGSARVFVRPSRHEGPADLAIDVDVQRFDADPDGAAVLVADWRVLDADGTAITSDTTTAETTIEGDYEATVAALSRTLGDLSDDIARAIRRSRR